MVMIRKSKFTLYQCQYFFIDFDVTLRLPYYIYCQQQIAEEKCNFNQNMLIDPSLEFNINLDRRGQEKCLIIQEQRIKMVSEEANVQSCSCTAT